MKLHGVGIGRFPRTGRGCVATRDIAAGDVLVEVPEDAVITADTSVAAPALEAMGIAGEGVESGAWPSLTHTTTRTQSTLLPAQLEYLRGAQWGPLKWYQGIPQLT